MIDHIGLVALEHSDLYSFVPFILWPLGRFWISRFLLQELLKQKLKNLDLGLYVNLIMLNLNFGGTQLEDSHFPTFTSLPEDIRELLEVYSNIPPNKVIPHIEEVVRGYPNQQKRYSCDVIMF